MGGAFTFDPQPLPLAMQPVPILVARYDRENQTYYPLPNLHCDQVERRDGLEPSAARFSYRLTSDPSSPWPSSAAQFWPLGAQGPYTVQPDDEVVVFGFTEDGTRRPIFDGFAQAPEVGIDGSGQRGTFAAVGVEVRAWDFPVDGAYQRDADDPDAAGPENHVATELPTRFNPNLHGVPQGNATPAGKDCNAGAKNAFPAFLEPLLVRNPDPAVKWTLPMAVRYLLYAPLYDGNAADGTPDGTTWVTPPDAKVVNKLLVDLKPRDGRTLDPSKPSTYDAKDLEVRDYDCSGKAWPDALEALLGYEGFGARFELSGDADGNPVTKLVLYRRDALGSPAPKPVQLQAPYQPLDPGQSNATTVRLARDGRKLANSVWVHTRPVLYEVSVILAPGFRVDDADIGNVAQFDLAMTQQPGATAQQRDAYRLFVADECGDGHWNTSSLAWATAALDLDGLFPPEGGAPTYVKRYRPGRGTLVSRDDAGAPRKVDLAISHDYGAVPDPLLWNGSAGTWQSVGHGDWHLLKDRLGVRITAKNPENWVIAPPGTAAPQSPSQVVHLVSALNPATPAGDPNWPIALKLTTVIEADLAIDAFAEKRPASPTRFEVRERVDAADAFRKEVVDKSSRYYVKDPSPAPRDDTDLAQAQAEALRASRETPRVAGSVLIPWLTNAYKIGDRVGSVDGVEIDLGESAAGEAGQAPTYPVVVGLSYSFAETSQQTTLLLGDARAELSETRPKTAAAPGKPGAAAGPAPGHGVDRRGVEAGRLSRLRRGGEG